MALARVIYKQVTAGVKTFAVPFPYLNKDNVWVTVNEIEVAFSWNSSTIVNLTVAPPVGAEIRVQRHTENENRLVDFVDGSTLTETELDLSAKQSFYLVQEAADDAEESLNVAKEAREIAKDAEETADNALEVAGQANAKSDQAVETANQANAKADSVLANLNKAVSDSAEALQTANEAKAGVAGATAAAEAATAAANNANQAAQEATQAAQNGNQAATEATTAANEAKATADQNTIDLTALTERVSTAEADIDTIDASLTEAAQIGIQNQSAISDINSKFHNITISTGEPNSGIDGDIWLQYSAT